VKPAPAKVADAASLGDKEEILKPKPAPAGEKAAQEAISSVAKPLPKPEPAKPEAKPEPKPTAKPDDAAKAKALLDGQTAASAEQGRFIVQVGAFADVAKARETRLRVEKTGLKTYTQVVETSEGKRIRVRVGPFASKAEADKAANTIKGLDLPASILTL
jgi:DedD protein